MKKEKYMNLFFQKFLKFLINTSQNFYYLLLAIIEND